MKDFRNRTREYKKNGDDASTYTKKNTCSRATTTPTKGDDRRCPALASKDDNVGEPAPRVNTTDTLSGGRCNVSPEEKEGKERGPTTKTTTKAAVRPNHKLWILKIKNRLPERREKECLEITRQRFFVLMHEEGVTRGIPGAEGSVTSAEMRLLDSPHAEEKMAKGSERGKVGVSTGCSTWSATMRMTPTEVQGMLTPLASGRCSSTNGDFLHWRPATNSVHYG